MWFVSGSEWSSMACAHLSGTGCAMAKTLGVGKPMTKHSSWANCQGQKPTGLQHAKPMHPSMPYAAPRLSNATVQCPMPNAHHCPMVNSKHRCPLPNASHAPCHMQFNKPHQCVSTFFFILIFQNPCPVQTCHTSPAHNVFAHGQGVLLVHVRPLHHCLVDPLNHNGLDVMASLTSTTNFHLPAMISCK